jgi:deoxyribonuclease-4
MIFMKIYLGPEGLPTISKGKTVPEGIKDLIDLGLNANEIQFTYGVRMDLKTAEECGKIANKKVLLSVHCPYYINLCSQEKEKLEASKKRIIESCERAEKMNATIATFHPGFYGKLSKEKAFDAVKSACEEIVDELKSRLIKSVNLGLETTGKQATFGTLEEIIEICKKVKRCLPVIDFSHIYARAGGEIDYGKIFDKLEQLKLTHYHTHFTGVEVSKLGIEKGNEKYHLEIKSNKPPFEPLAKEILKRKLDITIISESPVLEQDSLVMKKIFEKLGHRFK